MSKLKKEQHDDNPVDMEMFVEIQKIYLYREPIDFRKAIDRPCLAGLSAAPSCLPPSMSD